MLTASSSLRLFLVEKRDNHEENSHASQENPYSRQCQWVFLGRVKECLEVGWIWRIHELDTVYWGFLGAGTTLDIFQNIILIPYLEYSVLSPLDTAY
ncbi:hypothetical protein Tco_1107093 [Tanacetum coccineum]